MAKYRFSDVRAQEELLDNQLRLTTPAIRAKAFKSLYKRIDRFYGLNNKYLGNGKLRSKS